MWMLLAWLRGWRRWRRERWDVVIEHLALQHQVRGLQRSGTHRPRLTPWDRLFWLILSHLWPRWRGSLLIVQPGTVLKWRRQGLGLVFERRHDGRWRGGRPGVDAEVRELIVHMARLNLLWGAPRIHGELLKLGFTVSEATVSRCLRRLPRPRSQRWATFIRNHLLLRPTGFDPSPQYRQHVGKSISMRWPQYRHPSAEAQSKASRCARLFGYPRPGCAMRTPRDGRKEPKGIVEAWSYACPCDRSRMPLDTAPELLTFVLHHHCRIPFHMLPDYLRR